MSYRWNTSDFATGYDAAADVIHPHYLAIQDEILRLLGSRFPSSDSLLIVDLGGGSGRLMERILDRFPAAQGIVVDQSEPFLALAERRLIRFGGRATCILARLQDNWSREVQSPPTAFVSMSAIHHLDPKEKQSLYQRCHDLLGSGGILLNGDEVRPEDDRQYLATLNAWADHMRREMAASSIPPLFHTALHGWIDRNVTHFGQPKKSGDDCHESVATQLAYFRSAGFALADAPWQKDLWAVLRGAKPKMTAQIE
jgi:tRNA (cmo5U34)-methyltransferase